MRHPAVILEGSPCSNAAAKEGAKEGAKEALTVSEDRDAMQAVRLEAL